MGPGAGGRPHPMTPLAAVAAGFLADEVGTVSMDTYLLLPEGGLYKPIWEYNLPSPAEDLGGHLAYGAGTGTAFWLLTS
jgi:hypothetical protein